MDNIQMLFFEQLMDADRFFGESNEESLL